jgi:endonuclease YncB( thermonuclease family)
MKHLLILALFLLPFPAYAVDIQGTASVIDGDTLEIHGQRVRLSGVDAPESSQTCQDSRGKKWMCGQKAANALSDKIARRPVACKAVDKDRYGRVVAICSVAGESLNAWLVRNGWAAAYRQYSKAYAPDEDMARNAKTGIWQGEFDMPWDYRKNRKTGGAKASKPVPGVSGYTCGTKRTCKQMSTCEEARHYLTVCNLTRLDSDGDRTPCESLCR